MNTRVLYSAVALLAVANAIKLRNLADHQILIDSEGNVIGGPNVLPTEFTVSDGSLIGGDNVLPPEFTVSDGSLIGGDNVLPPVLAVNGQPIDGGDNVLPPVLAVNGQPMVGGPDSIPDFLKDITANADPIVGGPDSIPDFLKEPTDGPDSDSDSDSDEDGDCGCGCGGGCGCGCEEPEDPCKDYVDPYKQKVALIEAADRAAEDLVVAYEMEHRIELTSAQNKGMMEYFRERVGADFKKEMDKDPEFLEKLTYDIAEMDIAKDILDQFGEVELE